MFAGFGTSSIIRLHWIVEGPLDADLKPVGRNMRGYVAAWALACIATFLGGSLNAISPIVSNLFMMVYGIINLACFLAAYYSSPGWRPQFQWFDKWLALLGAVLCIVAMFLIDYTSGVVVLILSAIIYKWVEFKKTLLSGGAMEAAVFLDAANSVMRLEIMTVDSVKNFRPSFMVLANMCESVPGGAYAAPSSPSSTTTAPLPSRALQLSSLFYKSHALLMQGHVLLGGVGAHNIWRHRHAPKTIQVTSRFHAINKVLINPSLRNGLQALMMTAGMGKLSPNIVTLEFPEDWRDPSRAEYIVDMVYIIRLAMALGMAIMIVRAPRWRFNETEMQAGHIDVHWMMDDGGMTILLADLLRKSRQYRACSLRVFATEANEEKETFNYASNHMTYNAHTIKGQETKKELD